MFRLNTFRIISILLVGLALVFLLRSLLFADYVVNGGSMEPTLEDGNELLVNKIIYDLQDVDRFDVIVFHADEEDDYVKRVIGLPGDTIKYENGNLFVNGDYVEETFLDTVGSENRPVTYTQDFTLEENTGETEVPENQLFVLGDNRIDSVDSRKFGFISKDEIVGKVETQQEHIPDTENWFLL